MMKTSILILLMIISSITQAQQMEAAGLMYVLQKPRVESKNPPLLILLHGVGSNEQDLIGLTNHLPPQFTIVSVRAPYTLAKGSYAWYHLDFVGGKPVYKADEAEQSRKQLLNFIDEVRMTYHASEVVLLGFSQGAIMSYSVALTQPQKVGGIVALSGRVLTDIQPQLASSEQLKTLKVFIGHGKNDQVLPFFNGEAAYLKCQTLGTQVTFKAYPMSHEISEAELLDIRSWLQELISGNK